MIYQGVDALIDSISIKRLHENAWSPEQLCQHVDRLLSLSINTHRKAVGAGTKSCCSVFQTLFFQSKCKRKIMVRLCKTEC